MPPAAAQPEPDHKRIELILAGIDRLPTLPAVATRLLSVGSAEDIDLEEVIGLIESDPAMSGTILRLCRTADKGLGDKITTVRRAVIMLGLEAVQVAALSVHVYGQFEADDSDASPDAGSPFDRPGFWIHSLTVACAAEAIARAHPKMGVSPEQAYIAGLLHDLGKIALDHILPKAYTRVLGVAKDRRCALCVVEHTMLGIDHHTAGKRMAEHWKLPDTIRDAVWLHSQPIGTLPEGASRGVVSVVTLAESWARDLHLGWAGEFGEPLDLHELAAQTGIESAFFKKAAPAVIEAVSARGEALGLGEHARQDLLVESLTAANHRLATLNADLRRRAAAGASVGRLLQAIEVFNAGFAPGDLPRRVFCAMVESAAILVGSGRGAVIYQHSASDPWHAMVIDQGEVVSEPRRVESPPGDQESVRPGMLADANAARSMELAALDWLKDLFVTIREIGAPMLLGTRSGEQPTPDDQPSFLIIMPKAGSGIEQVVLAPEFAAVQHCWQRALEQAIGSQRSKRLGEELASANHTMTALRHELTAKESLIQLGKMAAGAAHEMNNPLSIIRGRSQQLFERLGSERERESARAIAAASDQLSDLITSLHMIADPPKPHIALGDPVLMVRQAIEIARDRCHTQKLRARVQLKTDGRIEPVPMDIDLLAQAVAEPIINAVQANPDAIVTVCIEPAMSKDRISIRISDRGPGFTETTIRHAFDPFFSELAAGRRSGLGLARARGLIELHRGEIELGNNPPGETGAEVVIHLNRADAGLKAA
ncbi:MAG: HDOD domain-containing protein [Phycisphaerales bacterium]